jgi:hypothetical protein
MPRNCTFFLLTQIFDSHKWPTVLVRTVKGKPQNFEANLCRSLYFTFTKSFQPYAFYNKRLQTLFKDQLIRSKATCFFKATGLFPRHREILSNTQPPYSRSWRRQFGYGQEPLSDAIVSTMHYCPLRTLLHMQSCPGLCKNRLEDMCMTVHVCASVHARNLRICSMIIHVFMIAATTQRPNMHLACKKIRDCENKRIFFKVTNHPMQRETRTILPLFPNNSAKTRSQKSETIIKSITQMASS